MSAPIIFSDITLPRAKPQINPTTIVILSFVGCIGIALLFVVSFILAVVIESTKANIHKIPGERIRDYPEFRTSFNSTYQMSNYVLYKFTTQSKRCPISNWKTEDFIITKFSTFMPRFQRGHLLPAIDVADSCATFVMTNVAPQHANFNGGAWRSLEEYVRRFVGCHILTAPKFGSVWAYNRVNQRFNVPDGFYKVVVCNGYLRFYGYFPHISYRAAWQDIIVDELPWFMR